MNYLILFLEKTVMILKVRSVLPLYCVASRFYSILWNNYYYTFPLLLGTDEPDNYDYDEYIDPKIGTIQRG